MVAATPAGIVASTFMFLYEKDSSFPGKLSRQLPGIPAIAVRVGALLNWMAERGITNGTVCPSINGQYPHAHIQSGGTDYKAAVSEVQNALQRLTMTANLTAAMGCVVGIQDSFLSIGVEQVMGAANATLKGSSSVYRTLSNAKGAFDKGKTGKDALKGLHDYIMSLRGDSVQLFLAAI